MKKYLIILLPLFLIGCSTSKDQKSSELQFSALLCENQVNPNHIDHPSPRLTWQMTSEKKGMHQSAYRILVASSKELLEEGKADLWDPGKIESSESVLVTYQGKALSSGQKYYWTVKVWDQKGLTSGYAKPAHWEMAILDSSLWQAKWISPPRVFNWSRRDGKIKQMARTQRDQTAPKEPMPLLRKSFEVQKEIISAKAYITGLGFFDLHVNGKKIGDNLLSPAFTDYSKTVLYEVMDVTDRLQQGENVLGVMLGNGWYNQISTDVWSFSRAPWRADPTLLCQLEIEYADGSKKVVVSDESWSCEEGPIRFSSIRLGETYDANWEAEGWDQPGFDDQQWHEVRVVRGPRGKLKAQNRPRVEIIDTLKPEEITRLGEESFLVDFGQNMAGFIEMKAKGEKGQKVRFVYGEKVGPNGGVDQSNIDPYIAESRFQTDEYVFKGEGVEQWHPRFNYHGFRYVEVNGWPGELTSDNLKAYFISADFKTTSRFKCSLPLINQIQENTLRSFYANFIHFPTDCPQREKLGWTGDAQLTSEALLYNFKLLNSYEEWVMDIVDSQKPNGALAPIVPTSGWGYDWGILPAWNHALFEIPWNLYLYEGDQRVLARIYPAMKNYLDFMAAQAENGVVKGGLGDWLPARTSTLPKVTSTAIYYRNLKMAAYIASLLKKDSEETAFKDKAEKIRAAYNREFFDNQTNEFLHPTQTGLASAVFMDLVDSSKVPTLVNQLKENIQTSDLNLDFGILGAKYVPNVLTDHGYQEVVYDMIDTTRYPGWGNWIEKGATTHWEDWEGENSLNHPMFGCIGEWFYKTLAGIQPDIESPGFKHFFIEPWFPPKMEWVDCVKHTGYGDIAVNWSKNESEISLKLQIPVNTSATVLLPSGELQIEGAKPETGKTGVIQAYPTEEENKLKLGSGNYEFVLAN